MKFYIQKNISEKDVNELVEILNKNKLSYELFYHIPFDDSYPQIDKEQHAFVYGASSVTDKVYKDLGVAGGVFAHTNEISLKPFFENNRFYIVKLAKVNPSVNLTFEQAKAKVIEDFKLNLKAKKLDELAQKHGFLKAMLIRTNRSRGTNRVS